MTTAAKAPATACCSGTGAQRHPHLRVLGSGLLVGDLVRRAGVHRPHLLLRRAIQIGDKALWVATSPWVGIGFLVVMFATLIFTHLRARGLHAVVLVLAAALVGLIVHLSIGWTRVFDQLTLIKVHMNLAYYVVVFVVSFVIWFYITFIHARLTYGVVNPGEVGWRSPLTGQMETYKPLNFQVIKRSDDLIVHKLLGLRFLGLGTGDIEVKFDVPGGGSQPHLFKNVWRPDAKVAGMEALISRER